MVHRPAYESVAGKVDPTETATPVVTVRPVAEVSIHTVEQYIVQQKAIGERFSCVWAGREGQPGVWDPEQY